MEFGLFTLFDFYPGRQDEVRYYRDTLELSVLADELGYDSIWVGEEHFYSFGVCPSPQIFLTAVAARTERIRLGTAISLLPFDNPLRKAEDFAVLDLLSGGRLDFGVGRGAIAKHFQGFDVDAGESRDRYQEAISVIKQAWSGGEVVHDGQFWRVPGVTVSPAPVQRPHPPIYQGTVSVESYEAAALAGDNAFVVPWTTGPHAELRPRLDRYRELVRANGAEGREAAMFFLFIDDDHRQAVREAREVTGRYSQHITSHAAARGGKDPKSTLFDRAEFMTSIPDHVEERGVVGRPDACIRRIKELDDELGLDKVAFYFHPGARDVASARRTIERFAHEVMPHFKDAGMRLATGV
ncbi:MAG TPA: LLM class flavin-dependent oxidoreductase [Acidimicrobiales bacterium]|nr:LLM class flavin-dependent oxidoreductase [Acidimicrobiales bacterium]